MRHSFRDGNQILLTLKTREPLHIALFQANYGGAHLGMSEWVWKKLAKGSDLFGCWAEFWNFSSFLKLFQLFNRSKNATDKARCYFWPRNKRIICCFWVLCLFKVEISFRLFVSQKCTKAPKHQKKNQIAPHEHQLDRFHTPNHIISRI